MSIDFYRIQKGLRLTPQASAPSTPLDGDMYYNSTTGKLVVRENGAWVSFASSAGGFQNGGNTFGANATIGLSDNFGLSILTNNATRIAINAAGQVGIGTVSTFAGLNIQGSLLTGSLQIGLWNQMTYTSAATDNDTSGFATTVSTENASFTTGHFKHFNANQISKGASNTITRLSGLYINSAAVTAGTNNAYISDNNSFSGDWAINFSNTRASSLGGALSVGGDLKVTTAGKGLFVAEGSNAKMGTATMVAGTVTVSTTAVTANSRIFLTVQSLGTVAVATPIAVTARTAATSFTISSSSVTDTSVVAWMLVEPA